MNKIVVVFSVSVIIFIATGIKFINSLDTHSRTSATEFLPDYKLESESVDPELIQTIKKKAIKSRVIALGFVKQNSCPTWRKGPLVPRTIMVKKGCWKFNMIFN